MGNLARGVLLCMPSARLYFCLLIVRYMLSDKIKGKSALNARTFLHVRDKVHVQAVYASIDGKQAQIKPFIGEIFTYKKHSDPSEQWSLTWISFVIDIKQTCLGAKIRSYNYREKTPI